MGSSGISPLRSAVLCLLAAVAAPSAAQAQLRAQPYVTGLSFPVGFIADPTASDRQFVVEQMGHIRVVVNGALLPDDFLDVTALVTPRTRIEAERGLLGMVLAPDYAVSGRFFIAFTRESVVPDERGDIVIARYTRSTSNPLQADPASRFDLRWGGPTGPTFIDHSARPAHNGCAMAFGSDGYLYIGLGDGGGNGDPDNNAQNPMELKGKILRIDVSVPDTDPQGYRVPADNPFLDGIPVAALPEIWAFGVRNPWRLTFDDAARGGTGALLIADVGQDRWEEVTYEPAGIGGRNYGWPLREAANPYYNTDIPNYVAPPGTFMPLSDPAFEYFHSAGVSIVEGYSLTGGYVYRGTGLGASMQGRYFFSDFALAKIWSAKVVPDGETAAFTDIIDHTSELTPGNMSTFGVDAHGELYLVKYGVTGRGVVSRVCGFTPALALASFSASGGTGTLQVTAPAGCAWTVSSADPWISVLSDDTAVGSRTVVFRVWPNSGAPRTGSLIVAGQRVAVSQGNAVAVGGDFDNSGTADLVWQHADGRPAVWLMKGTALADARPIGPGALPDPAWRIAASGDFDRDGSADLVFQHQGDGRLAVWLLSGDTLLAADELTPGSVTDLDWKIRGAADFDRDGWMDLIWQHQTSGAIGVWLMSGTRLRDAHLFSPDMVADLGWRIVGAGDMNGDGHTDLIWQHDTNGSIATWLMNGSSMRSAILLSPGQVPDTNWKIRGVTDFNADGQPDLIWQNQVTGHLSVWFMRGTELADGVRFTPESVGDTNWQIVGPR